MLNQSCFFMYDFIIYILDDLDGYPSKPECGPNEEWHACAVLEPCEPKCGQVSRTLCPLVRKYNSYYDNYTITIIGLLLFYYIDLYLGGVRNRLMYLNIIRKHIVDVRK